MINNNMVCRHCLIKTSPNKSGLTRHEKHCIKNPDFVPNTGGRKWPPGDIRYKHTEEIKRKISLRATGVAATADNEKLRRDRISEKAKLNNGGYRHGSGRGKKDGIIISSVTVVGNWPM